MDLSQHWHPDGKRILFAVQEALRLVKEKPRMIYPRPKFEDRSAKGLKEAF